MEKILLWPDPEEKSVRPGPAPSPLRSSPEQGASVPQAPHAPADATLGAVVLLLVAVEEVADPAVVLAEEVVAPLAALLDLPSHGEDEEEPGRGSLAARLALPNMAPPPNMAVHSSPADPPSARGGSGCTSPRPRGSGLAGAPRRRRGTAGRRTASRSTAPTNGTERIGSE